MEHGLLGVTEALAFDDRLNVSPIDADLPSSVTCLKGGQEHLVVLRHIRCGHGFALLLAYESAIRSIMVGSGQPFHRLGADAHFCAQRAVLGGRTP